MKSIQLDESFNDADFAAACAAEGKCYILPYPNHRKGQKDHEMIPALLVTDFPLLTLDHRFIDENRDCITDTNGGVIVVKLEHATRTITTRIGARIIGVFKEKFPRWPSVNWDRVYLELTETDAFICPLTGNPDITLHRGVAVEYDAPNFEQQIQEAIRRFSSPHAIAQH